MYRYFSQVFCLGIVSIPTYLLIFVDLGVIENLKIVRGSREI